MTNIVKEQTDNRAEEARRQGLQRRRWWGSLLTEGESEAEESKSLRELVGTLNIDGRWFFQQIPLLLLIVGGFLLMVTSRYQAQQEIIEKEQLQRDVEDWRFRALTRSSELTTRTRQSQIEKQLKLQGDSLLTIPTEPSFTINLDN